MSSSSCPQWTLSNLPAWRQTWRSHKARLDFQISQNSPPAHCINKQPRVRCVRSRQPGVLLSPDHSAYPDATSLFSVLFTGEPVAAPWVSILLSQAALLPFCSVIFSLVLISMAVVFTGALLLISLLHFLQAQSARDAVLPQFRIEKKHEIPKRCVKLREDALYSSPADPRCDLWFWLVKNGSIFFWLPNLCCLSFQGASQPRTGEGVFLSREVEADRW